MGGGTACGTTRGFSGSVSASSMFAWQLWYPACHLGESVLSATLFRPILWPPYIDFVRSEWFMFLHNCRCFPVLWSHFGFHSNKITRLKWGSSLVPRQSCLYFSFSLPCFILALISLMLCASGSSRPQATGSVVLSLRPMESWDGERLIPWIGVALYSRSALFLSLFFLHSDFTAGVLGTH